MQVLIVDDHVGYRTVASAVVAATTGFELMGVADSVDEARRKVASGPPPDLVLMDVNLGDESGVDLTRELAEAHPSMNVLLVSVLRRDELPPEAETCGAIGYLPKARLSPAALEAARAGEYDWRP